MENQYLYVRNHLWIPMYWLHLDIRATIWPSDTQRCQIYHGMVAFEALRYS